MGSEWIHGGAHLAKPNDQRGWRSGQDGKHPLGPSSVQFRARVGEGPRLSTLSAERTGASD